MTAGQGAPDARLDRGVGEPRRDQVIVRHAGAVARRVEIADEDNRQVRGRGPAQQLGRLRLLDRGRCASGNISAAASTEPMSRL
jgi:hypothetical protein